MYNKSWFAGRNILVTGGNGFIAATLVVKLAELGANVHITTRHYSEYNTIKMLSNHDVTYDTTITNMYQYNDVKNILDRHQIEIIFHLAASAIVSEGANSPASTFYNNLLPSLNILEAARINKVPRILIASTDKAYGDHTEPGSREPLPYREDYALRGLDAYASSKATIDLISQAFALQYQQHILVTRCSNTYGPGDMNISRLIPKTILRILAQKPPVINQGNDHVLREYMYVGDIADTYLFLAQHIDEYYKEEYPRRGDKAYGWPCFNIGSYSSDMNNDFSNPGNLPNIKNPRAIISLINELITQEYGIGKIEPVIKKKTAEFIEAPDQYLDSTKIINLGFRPKTDLREGLKKTIEWYHENFTFLQKFGASYLEE
jgi:CDP-glucose 4,6-dehydratase